MKKKFECLPECDEQYLDMVVLSCKKCIKHIQYPLTRKQAEEIVKIINNKDGLKRYK